MMYFGPQIRSAARMHTYIRNDKTTVVQYGVRNSTLSDSLSYVTFCKPFI